MTLFWLSAAGLALTLLMAGAAAQSPAWLQKPIPERWSGRHSWTTWLAPAS